MFRNALDDSRSRFAVAILGLGFLQSVTSAPPAREPTDTPIPAPFGDITNRNVLYGPGEADTAAVRHLLSRATFGVRPADLERALTIGVDAWLSEQLEPGRIADHGMEQRLAIYPAASMEQAELYERFPPPQVLQRELRPMQGEDGTAQPDSDAIQRIRREMGVQPPQRILFDLVGAKLQRAVYSERQLEEVMADFWFNHFNVFFAKAADRWLVGEYEREAIRPHVFGSFESMLVATAQHPAMQFYLDNWTNVAPDSLRPTDPGMEGLRRLPEGRRRRFLERQGFDEQQIEQIRQVMERRQQMQSGINENYARELLELHTLGVDAGYDQNDVIEVARVFTGWGIRRPGRGGTGPISFSYQPRLHDPTDKTVLGEPVPGRDGGAGLGEGLEVLSRLATHPATARHIATKLAVAFVADNPPEGIVAELGQVFLETGGDLKAVTYALFTSPHFYDPATYHAKLKTPFELIASALRVSDARVGPSRQLFGMMRDMGELPFLAQAPTGYPDENEDWGSSGALLQRVNFAIGLAANGIQGARVPNPGRLEDIPATILPGMDVTALVETIAEELEAGGVPRDQRARRALGLALGSPEFQAR